MTVFPLSEGAFTVDKSKAFVPFIKDSDDLQARPLGSLLVEIQPFAVRTSRDVILIDTGLGFIKENGQLQLHENLRSVGIQPGEITKVLLSHLHKDHSSGIAVKNEAGETQLSFPQASYYVNENELEEALSEDNPSYITAELEILSGAEQVILTGNEGEIDDYIHYKVSGGHSPHHQVFTIKEEGEIIFFGGDVAPQMQQMKNRFIAKYDFDGRRSMELRQEWWERGAKEDWTFLFYHDIKTPTGKA